VHPARAWTSRKDLSYDASFDDLLQGDPATAGNLVRTLDWINGGITFKRFATLSECRATPQVRTGR
jgi:hypothetical protein